MNDATRKANPARHAAYVARRRAADPEAARAREAAYREAHREAVNEGARRRAATPHGRAREPAYRATHKEQRKASNLRYKEEHGERKEAYDRAYRSANRQVVKERSRRSRAAKLEQYKQVQASWKKANKHLVNAQTHRRRYALRRNGGMWMPDEWERIKARQDWRCLMCHRQEMTDGITLCRDHVVPIDLRGYNIASNLQGLCRSCNSKKHRKVLDLRVGFYRH